MGITIGSRRIDEETTLVDLANICKAYDIFKQHYGVSFDYHMSGIMNDIKSRINRWQGSTYYDTWQELVNDEDEIDYVTELYVGKLSLFDSRENVDVERAVWLFTVILGYALHDSAVTYIQRSTEHKKYSPEDRTKYAWLGWDIQRFKMNFEVMLKDRQIHKLRRYKYAYEDLFSQHYANAFFTESGDIEHLT